MKVSELIEKLKEMPQEAEVFVQAMSDYYIMNISSVVSDEDTKFVLVRVDD